MNSQWPGSADPWGDRTGPWPPTGGGAHDASGTPWHPAPPPVPSGLPPVSGPPLARGNAVLALIIAIILTMTCVGVTDVIGIVLAAVALSKDQDPEEFDRYVRWAWLSNFIHVGFLVLLLVLFLTLSTL
ncbi:hypothetical protein [Thermobifida cellulosilytica]|uniref:Uncharacterized protein n=1 Tax=Thermobifida cellulosilytica TB100 TaxID=665004 RepID=A0A147KLW5_THECS|nr:hypothetical protein [Thermobifida cellulosilytica]KUP98277.1 hypothetical protein AC529_02210 [Thermobifida cellulosilytica TB100]